VGQTTFTQLHRPPKNLESLLPIKVVIGLLQIYVDLVERALITPGQALVELGLDPGCPCTPPQKCHHDFLIDLPTRF